MNNVLKKVSFILMLIIFMVVFNLNDAMAGRDITAPKLNSIKFTMDSVEKPGVITAEMDVEEEETGIVMVSIICCKLGYMPADKQIF